MQSINSYAEITGFFFEYADIVFIWMQQIIIYRFNIKSFRRSISAFGVFVLHVNTTIVENNK
ncbi:MAG: hypothetical protein DI604_24190 [Delftia acidovorans]|nr:MAG: hypothetical protein DI604_24190 [Delftia acidovorans]